MPSIVALIDTGEPLCEGLTRKEHVEVLKVSTEELARAVRQDNIAELLRRAAREAEKLRGHIVGYYFKAKSLSRVGLNGHLFKPGRDF